MRQRILPAFGLGLLATVSIGVAAQPAVPVGSGRPDARTEARLEALTLDDAQQLVDERNRELRAAFWRVEAARADGAIAGQRPNPVLSVGLSSPFRTSGASRLHATGEGARVDQLIERGNKRELRVAAAAEALRASGADYAETRRVQRLAAATAFYDLKQAEQRLDANRETESLLGRLIAAMELRLKAGDIAPADLARVRVEALRASNETAAADAERRAAQVDLAALLGLEGLASRIRTGEDWPGGEVPQAPDPERMLEARADVRAARHRFALASKARDLVLAQRVRDVSIGLGADRSMPESGQSFLSVSVSVPLFVYHRFDGEVRRAETEVLAAGDDVERVRAAARAELERARAAVEGARERRERYRRELLAQAERSAQAVEFAYRNGAAGLIDLIDARRTLFATRLDAVAAEADYARALSAWRAALTPMEEGR